MLRRKTGLGDASTLVGRVEPVLPAMMSQDQRLKSLIRSLSTPSNSAMIVVGTGTASSLTISIRVRRFR